MADIHEVIMMTVRTFDLWKPSAHSPRGGIMDVEEKGQSSE